jgi:ElaB/YqjD/DUF883 family membrane-anchored ribosome-binding protein
MEVYYKDFISEETSLEKLVDDLARVVQGADELAQASGVNLPEDKRREIRTRLERLKEQCGKLKEQAVAGARATDKLLRRHPYSSLGIAIGCGLLMGLLLCRREK